LVYGQDKNKVDPIFILFLDAVSQLIKANPLSFEFMTSYLAFIASEVYSNRFFEFIQSDKVDESHRNLPTVFGEEHRVGHYNPIFNTKTS